jgi:tetratricopeptide (TPR) repeat protein
VSPRPAIFISAVSKELRSARQLVSNTLTFLGYEPEWQDIFSTEEGDLRGMLRRRVDACKGVVQLVGQCYGAEPPTIDEQFGRVSYTQYEALYARQQKKKVWYLILNDDFTTDPYEAEPQELHDLQIAYRKRLKSENVVRHSLSSRDALEADVLKLRDELTRLRRGVKQWAVGVVVLLVLSVGLGVWSLQRQAAVNASQAALNAKMDKVLAQGVVQYAPTESKVKQEQPGKLNPAEVQQRTYEELAKQLGIDAKVLQEKLPEFANELKNAPNASTYERANAAYVAKDYSEAERLALAAADEAEKASPPKTSDVIKALELAGGSANARIEYARALQHFRDAAKLTDRARDPLEWASQQWKIAYVLEEQGNYAEAETQYRVVLKLQEKVLGPEHQDTLKSRTGLADALSDNGKYAEAETEYRAVIKLEEKALGPEHPGTLGSRMNLALALNDQGKYAEAETESRGVIKLQEKVLGPEHPDTLGNRNNLANALRRKSKYAEAESEYRAVIKLEEKVLGPEHPNTLTSRMNLASALLGQSKYAEAEMEYRDVIKLQEKVVGPEHPNTLASRNNLAIALKKQRKYAEAQTEYRAVIKLKEKVLGPEHPDTLASRTNLANALVGQGEYAEAETEYRKVIQLEEKVLGQDHPITLGSRRSLALTLSHEAKYGEAVEVQRRVVVSIGDKTGNEDQRQKELTDDYNSLSWYQLFQKDVAGAFASIDIARKLGDSSLELDKNRAHALLFLRRTKEAEEIYLKHRGEKFEDGRDWTAVILQDFDDLEKAGVTSPKFTNIRKLLKTETKPEAHSKNP